MREPSTQDIQKVFNSATDKFTSFVGGVESVSQTEHMKKMYDNMTRLFDTFTNGVLVGQGAYSTNVLRAVYRSLNADFLRIIDDSKAVDKIAEILKERQKAASSGSASVSNTTRQVADNTLDPNKVDLMDVCLDFVNELQNAILQVKLNLNREYERQKLAYAKSAAGQQEDLERLNEESSNQTQQIVETMTTLSEEEKVWRDEQFRQLEELKNTFDAIGQDQTDVGKAYSTLGGIDVRGLQERLAGGILPKDIQKRIETEVNSMNVQISDLKARIDQLEKQNSQTDDLQKENEKNLDKIAKLKKKVSELQDKMEKVKAEKNGKGGSDKAMDSTKIADATKNIKPPKGEQEAASQSRGQGQQIPASQPQIADQNSQSLTKEQVNTTLGRINANIHSILKDRKFVQNFMLDYGGIQNAVGKQMAKISKSEEKIGSDLEKTESNVVKLKKKRRSNLSTMLLNLGSGALNIFFVAVGGLILIGLMRLAFAKWKKAYMPKSDGSTMTIFGVQIPGWAEMKALFIGIRNFIVVGLPNMWDRLSSLIGKATKSLFGPKGAFRGMEQTKASLIKIGAAWMIGQTKGTGGTVVGLILKIIGWAFAWVPGVKPVCNFLAKFGPVLYTFIMNKIVGAAANAYANAERAFAQAKVSQHLYTQKAQGRFRDMLMGMARKVRPFKNQISAIPGLELPRIDGKDAGRGRGAIMKRVPVKAHGNSRMSSKMQKKAVEDDFSGRNRDADIEAIKSNPLMQQLIKFQKNKYKIVQEEMRKPIAQRKNIHRLDLGMRGYIYQNTVQKQVDAIDEYIKELKKSKRFQNVQGVLYDPIKGWNPGYRVLQSDLMTAIPLNPFEEIHKKRDIPFGTPAKPEADSIGFMPFKWFQNGVAVSADPLQYEIERAVKIRNMWWNLVHRLMKGMYGDASLQMSPEKYLNKVIDEFYPAWRSLSNVTQVQYENPKRVLYGDKFEKFLNAYRNDQISDKNNFKEYIDSKWESRIGSEGGDSHSGMFDRWARNDELKMLELGYNSNRQVATGLGSSIVNWKRERMDRARLAMWKMKTAYGIRYNDIREFVLGADGLRDTLTAVIRNPIRKAEQFLRQISQFAGMIPARKNRSWSWLSSLFDLYFSNSGIRGDLDWEKSGGASDVRAKAGFAQIFIEYLAKVTMPKWRRMEVLLHNVMSNENEKTASEAEKGLQELAFTFVDTKGLVEFMSKYLKFPNMRINIIDYGNAKGAEQIKRLNEFRMRLGIPDLFIRNRLVQMVNRGRSSNPQGDVDFIRKWLPGLAKEALATGDHDLYDKVKKHYDSLSSLLQQNSEDSKIVNAAFPKIVVDIQPQKSPEEMEEERRKEEAERKAKEAEERRKKEEEERKRLAEEAKRKEALAIANAKIKAMEAIRRQEQKYETILEKMVQDPGKVTDAELKSLGEGVDNLKQEAENRIAQLPREEREVKLALIRGDKVSPKTFTELKNTAVGLHGNLQAYMEEVNQIPVGSVFAINRTPGMASRIQMQDSDAVDLAS